MRSALVLGFYAEYSNSLLPTLLGKKKLLVPPSRVILDWLAVQYGTDRLSRNVVKKYRSTLRRISEERRSDWQQCS